MVTTDSNPNSSIPTSPTSTQENEGGNNDELGQNQEEAQPNATLGRHETQTRTYAQALEPKRGMKLEFSKYEVVEGVKIAKIEKEDVESEVKYWESAIVCCVLGANPPSRSWKDF